MLQTFIHHRTLVQLWKPKKSSYCARGYSSLSSSFWNNSIFCCVLIHRIRKFTIILGLHCKNTICNGYNYIAKSKKNFLMTLFWRLWITCDRLTSFFVHRKTKNKENKVVTYISFVFEAIIIINFLRLKSIFIIFVSILFNIYRCSIDYCMKNNAIVQNHNLISGNFAFFIICNNLKGIFCSKNGFCMKNKYNMKRDLI